MSRPWVTIGLVLALAAGAALQLELPADILARLILWPDQDFARWQLVTYGFLHGSVWHLASNSIGLLLLGRRLENRLGGTELLLLFGLCLVIAGGVQALLLAALGSSCGTIGASGAVMGLLGASARLWRGTWVLVVALAVAELAASDPGVSHVAHLAGFVAGWWLIGARA